MDIPLEECCYCQGQVSQNEATKIMNFAGAEFFDARLAGSLPEPKYFWNLFKKKRIESPKWPALWICETHQKDSWYGPTTSKSISKNQLPTYLQTPLVQIYAQEVLFEDGCAKCGRIGVPWITPLNPTSSKALGRLIDPNSWEPIEGARMCRNHFPENLLQGEIKVNFRNYNKITHGKFGEVTVDCVYCEYCETTCAPDEGLPVNDCDQLPQSAPVHLIERILNMPTEIFYICKKHYVPGVEENCRVCRRLPGNLFNLGVDAVRHSMSQYWRVSLDTKSKICTSHIPEKFISRRKGELHLMSVICDYCQGMVHLLDTYGGFAPEFLNSPFPKNFLARVEKKDFCNVRICRRHYKGHDGSRATSQLHYSIMAALKTPKQEMTGGREEKAMKRQHSGNEAHSWDGSSQQFDDFLSFWNKNAIREAVGKIDEEESEEPLFKLPKPESISGMKIAKDQKGTKRLKDLISL